MDSLKLSFYRSAYTIAGVRLRSALRFGNKKNADSKEPTFSIFQTCKYNTVPRGVSGVEPRSITSESPRHKQPQQLPLRLPT